MRGIHLVVSRWALVPISLAAPSVSTQTSVCKTVNDSWRSIDANGNAVIKSLASRVTGARKMSSVTLVSSKRAVAFLQKADGLHVRVPAEAPGKNEYVCPIAFRWG